MHLRLLESQTVPATMARAALELLHRRIQRALLVASPLERLQHLIEAEAADFLARRKLPERTQELPDISLRGNQQEHTFSHPTFIAHAMLVSRLEGVRADVE